jgi:peptide/nickel transport system permease protein
MDIGPAFRTVYRNKKLFIGSIMLLVFVAIGVLAPLIAPFPYDQTRVGPSLQPPSLEYLFGTDRLGRDVFSRVIYGTQVSLIAAISVTFLSLLVGVPVGVLGPLYGGRIDLILGRIVDIVLSFPWVLVGMIVVVIRGQGLTSVIIALSIGYFPNIVRVLRSAVLSIKEQDYVTAARLTGENELKIILRYVLPNSISPLIVQSTIIMSFAILGEAALSYLGYGTRPPLPSWGILLQEATNYMWANPNLVIFPGIFVVFVVLSFNFTGDGLRDLLDPRYKRTFQ